MKPPSIIVFCVLLSGAVALRAAGHQDDTRADQWGKFAENLANLEPGDHEAAMAVAEKAIELGLPDEAEDLYRRILREDQSHEAAYHALWHLSDSQPLPRTSRAYDQARQLLPEPFQVSETEHYVILSDADPRWLREQAKRLERAYDRFIRFARSLDLKPQPLRHKLVAVVFNQLDEFSRFGERDGTPTGQRIAGYYSPRADRLVFYHVESDENVARARARLEQLQSEIDGIRRAARRTSRTGRRAEAREMSQGLDGKEQQHQQQERRLDQFATQQSITVTIHEAIHQLMFHSRVQSPHVQHPLWLSEGLATAFETDAPASQFGPMHEFELRRQGFYQLLDHDRLLPLPEILTLDHQRLQGRPAKVNALYHQSYALVTWMCHERRLELAEYLRRLNALPRGAPSAERHLEIFQEVFGDIDRLEKIWLRHERASG